MHQINSTHLKNKKNRTKQFLPFFWSFERSFDALDIGIAKVGLQIRPRFPRIRLYVNFGKFGCIISIEDNQLACSFGHSVDGLGS